MSSRTNLPFLVALMILAVATLAVAAMQLSDGVPMSPWEPSIAMEAMRLNAGLPLYDTAHATHLYGPLLTVLLAGVFQLFGLQLIAARCVMSIFGFGLAGALSATLCRGKSRACWVIAILLVLGINLRTNLILFSIQPDWAGAFLAILGLAVWAVWRNSPAGFFVSIALMICATLLKQTSAAVALVPVIHVLIWKKQHRLRDLAVSLLPAIAILVALVVIRWLWPQMFAAMVSIPGAIKVYPGRAFRIALYLFATFPIFLIALWSVSRSRSSIADRDRWILAALIVLVPISIWTTCKSGAGYNSLLFAYLAMTALFIYRLDAICEWLRSLSAWRSFVSAVAIAVAILVSFLFQADRAITLLSIRHGDDKYGAAVDLARHLNGVVRTPQDPTIAYRAKHDFGRSLYFELDSHAVNGNWPEELPASMVAELTEADYIIAIRSYVPTPVFENSLPGNGFQPVAIPELTDSVYTLWSRSAENGASRK